MKQVLIIDDADDVRVMLRMALEIDGFDVVDTRGGEDGLEALRRCAAEGLDPVVILDVQMPGISGWEVLDTIRDEPGLTGTRVVMCTVRADSVERDEGLRMGADAYVAKPFDLATLVTVVNELAVLSSAEARVRRAMMADSIITATDRS